MHSTKLTSVPWEPTESMIWSRGIEECTRDNNAWLEAKDLFMQSWTSLVHGTGADEATARSTVAAAGVC